VQRENEKNVDSRFLFLFKDNSSPKMKNIWKILNLLTRALWASASVLNAREFFG
jgi:hypothetical protein